tara:strand:+ start:147 stop:371 length:225 start_codon:yes stop_codon:yes gene_type:complete
MAFKMSNPFKQEKTSGFGPREKIDCPGDMRYHEPSGKCLSPEAYEDAMGVGSGSNKKPPQTKKDDWDPSWRFKK